MPRREHIGRLFATEGAQLWIVASYMAVGLGCALRALRWIDNPGLWLDESFLAINLLDKSFADILGPLRFLQAAPPAYLLAAKSAQTLLGDAEWSLRLVPIGASLVSVVLFAYVARRLLAPPAAVLAILLFATGEPLLLRAADVKHYSVDVAVTTGLLALYLWAVSARPEHTKRRLVVLTVVAPFVLWLSFPAAFTIAALVAALALHGRQRRSGAATATAGILAVFALVTFVAVYAIAAGNASRVSASLFSSADAGLAVGRLKTLENAWWMFVEPGGFDNEVNSLAALLAGFGLIALLRRDQLDRLALLAVPLALAAVADLIDRYPLGGRFSLFLVPFILLLVARGAQAVVGWSRRPVLVATGVGVFLVAPQLAIASYHTLEPPARSDVKPLLQHLIRAWEEGDSLYVYMDSQYQLRYYSQCDDCAISGADFPWPTRLAPAGEPRDQYAPALESVPPEVVIGSREGSDQPVGDLELLPRAGRVWLLFSTEPRKHDGLDDERLLLRALERDGALIEEITARGARLYLVERMAPP